MGLNQAVHRSIRDEGKNESFKSMIMGKQNYTGCVWNSTNYHTIIFIQKLEEQELECVNLPLMCML
jgi:hypothetical protein